MNVTRGPKIPKGEASWLLRNPAGSRATAIVSDGITCAYRMRIRTPGFPNVQVVP
ncbi:MAG: hypothetical protein R2941_04175 [Desulfobacterales bacterium]